MADGLELDFAVDVKRLRESGEIFRRAVPKVDADGNAAEGRGAGHPGEEGRWTESLVAEFLRKRLPSNLEVSSGFVADPRHSNRSYQVDVLVHDPNTIAPMLRYGDAVIVHPHAVKAAISVKYTLRKRDLAKEIRELASVGDLCNRAHAKGPYLAILGFELEKSTRGNFRAASESMARAVVENFSELSGRPTKVSSNELVDAVVALEGLIIKTSKGHDYGTNYRKEPKVLWGGAGRESYAIGVEIVNGICGNLPYYEDIEALPGRQGQGMTPVDKVTTVCFGRPPS